MKLWIFGLGVVQGRANPRAQITGYGGGYGDYYSGDGFGDREACLYFIGAHDGSGEPGHPLPPVIALIPVIYEVRP